MRLAGASKAPSVAFADAGYCMQWNGVLTGGKVAIKITLQP
jgi:hypothetical protein